VASVWNGSPIRQASPSARADSTVFVVVVVIEVIVAPRILVHALSHRFCDYEYDNDNDNDGAELVLDWLLRGRG
jgi:hypothetical protein